MSEEATSKSMIPRHVAFIMDGNRRWAKKHNLPTEAGHKAGYDRFKEVVDYAFSLGVEYVTVYAFSTENWKRTESEVSGIMSLARYVANNEISKYAERNIRVNIIGHKTDLPLDLQKKIEEVESDTSGDDGGTINIAFSYGGRAEIVDAVNAAINEGLAITEETIENHLYTKGQPNPELIIRTGGSPRLSNFLMWQSVYSEIYLSDTLWPDFDGKELDKALDFYTKINRNFGR
jgi:undecaprenyl diphosphate synthase